MDRLDILTHIILIIRELSDARIKIICCCLEIFLGGRKFRVGAEKAHKVMKDFTNFILKLLQFYFI